MILTGKPILLYPDGLEKEIGWFACLGYLAIALLWYVSLTVGMLLILAPFLGLLPVVAIFATYDYMTGKTKSCA